MRFRKLVPVAGVTLAAAGLLAGSAGATPRPHSFEGTCDLSGQLSFAEPLGDVPRSTTLEDSATGTCSGSVDGVPVQDAPVRNSATGSGTLGCLGGEATTADTLQFGRGVSVDFTTQTAGGLTQFAARFTGRVAGEGVVHVSFLPYLDQAALDACQAGTFGSARYDLEARTLGPVTG